MTQVPSPMTAPLFIVGANRSGTTLLRLILNAHSEVAIPDEINYFFSFRGGAGYSRWWAPDLTRREFEDFVEDFLAANRDVTPELDPTALRSDILDGPPDLRRPYQLLLERWAQYHGKSKWGEKTPGNLFSAHIILSMFPDARFVHLVRDPRAVVHSMQRVSFFPTDVVLNALNLRKALEEGQRHLERSVPAAQRIRVRYEDLVHEPERTVRRICDFSGLAFEAPMLNFHENAARYMTPAASHSFNSTATRPISKSRTDAWTAHLTADEISLIELLNQRSMARFGYRPEGRRPSLSGWGELAWKCAYWQYHHWRNRKVPQYVVRHSAFEGLRQRLTRWGARLSRSLAFMRRP